MSKIILTLQLVFALMCSGLGLQATHIVGGELYYEDLGGGDYEITLKVYRDCGPTNTNGTDFDDQAIVGIYSNGVLIEALSMSIFSAEVSFVPVVLENPCFVLPPDVCVEEAIYTEIVWLPADADGYDIVYQRCCRNPSIININFPQDSGVSFWTQIPGSEDVPEDNSCPVFTNFPPVALCLNAQFWFDHSATDLDGDSLVYEFCSPMLGGTPEFPAPNPPMAPPYNEVSWALGFSEAYPITSDPGFSIDPLTGLLEGTPTQAGQYVLGICVKEYRDGVLLSHTNRDFQFNVTVCDPYIVAAIPEQTQFCDGLTFEFTNTSINAEDFLWDFGDPYNSFDQSTEVNPTYTYQDTGVFTVTLIANPGWPCADTAFQQFAAYPLIEPGLVMSDFECIDDVGYFDFDAIGNYDEDAVFTWDFGPTSEPQFVEGPFANDIILGDPGEYEIEITITSNGCEESGTDVVVVPEDPVAVIDPQEGFCVGLEYVFSESSFNEESLYWDLGDPTSDNDVSGASNPAYFYPDTGHYTVSLTASADLTCPHTTSEVFELYTLLAPFFPSQPSQCLDGNSFDFAAEGTEDSQADYDWDFGEEANPEFSSSSNPQNISFLTEGIHSITLTISENGCVESYTDEIQLYPNPYAGYYIQNEIGCPPLYVNFQDTSFAATQLYYLWDFGDGTNSTSPNPTHIYTNPGSYDVSVTIATAQGCIQEFNFFDPDAVQVYPPPSAGFDVHPQTVNILDPEIEITDLSAGSIDCTYFMTDGGSMDDCNGFYTFLDGGYHDIYQVVIDQNGCSDTAWAKVAVEGYTFFAPNSFTPNNDGTNDIWLPVALGVTQYDLTVYNRWGEPIFYTNDRLEPWTGSVNGGEHFAQDGVYLYHVILHDLLSFPHEFNGHITLIR